MKKLMILATLALLAGGSAFGQGSVSNPKFLHLTDQGSTFPLLREGLDSGTGKKPYLIHMDTLEVDTGYMVFNLLEHPLYSYNDTIGTASFTCKDSTGTDTLAIVLKWQGNPRADGKGAWANVDSVELKDLAASGAAGNGVYTNKAAVVVNSGGYSAFRFFLKNKLAANANRKSTCKDPILIHRRRLGAR